MSKDTGMDDITDAEMDNLSDAEREALSGTDEMDAADDGVNDELDASPDDDVDNGEEAAAESDDAGDEAAAAESSDDGDDGDEAQKAAADDDSDYVEPFTPQYNAEMPEEIEAKLKELDEKFEDGEISLSEYNAERDPLNLAKIKAELASEQNEQVAEQLWQYQQKLFMQDHSEYKDNPVAMSMLNAALNTLYADESNAGKDGLWFLRNADKLAKEKAAEFTGANKADELGDLGEKNTPNPPNPPRRQGKGKEAKRTAPPTLSQTPQADSSISGDTAFDSMDNLDGMDLEQALARMPESERDKYLAAH